VISIRRGTVRDLREIAAIQGESREASQWAAEDYLPYTIHVAEYDSGPVGFVVTRAVAPGEYEILNIAVRPECRRQGVARALIEAVGSESPGVFYLEVRESNESARLFYRASGFAEVGRRPKYYNNPEEAAIVMRICS
jgi:[ribosomal protein S18]-alanine N-acetyltransferase